MAQNNTSIRFVFHARRPPYISVFFGISKQIATKDKISIRFGTCYIKLLRKIMYKNYGDGYTQGLVMRGAYTPDLAPSCDGCEPGKGSAAGRRRQRRCGDAKRQGYPARTRSAVVYVYIIHGIYTYRTCIRLRVPRQKSAITKISAVLSLWWGIRPDSIMLHMGLSRKSAFCLTLFVEIPKKTLAVRAFL
jgi:hypothetical protein